MTRDSSRPPGSGSPIGSRGGAPVATPVPAGLIGRYQVLDKIGDGGMGSLFLARDPAIDRLVAIKVLRHGLDTEALRERFAREARAAGRLRHPHIVTIFDVGDHGGDPFIAMEFLAGETLAELIRNGARLSLSRRLKLLEELCDGLAYAHRSGLVHRDIKPANLMVDADGVLKILDFGIVRVSDSGMTQAGVLVGTVNYMSPEQVVGAPVDHRSDIFAVGLVAYELISGRQAFAGTMKDGLLNKILHEPAEPLWAVAPGVDVEVASLVDQALQKDPADRYQDLVRMRNDLARARVRIEREEERSAAAAAADAGETAVIWEHATSAGEPPAPAPIVNDAERALAVGNFRAALTLAGRSAAINPQDRTASSIAARAEAALLERGRLLQSGTPVPKGDPVSSLPPALPSSSASGLQAVGGHALWIAVAIALLALAVAVAALWLRNPAVRPPEIAREASGPGSPPQEPRDQTPRGAAGSDRTTPQAPAGPPMAEPVVEPPPFSPPAAPPAVAESVSRGSTPPAPRRRAAPPRAAEAQRSTPASGGVPAPTPPPTPSAPAGGERAPTVLRAGVDTSPPRMTRYVPPTYPAEAHAAGTEGTVELELTIGPDGRVAEARVVRSIRGLDEAAIAATRQWEFAPPRQNGEPVSLVYPTSVPFKLPEPARLPPPAPAPAPPPPAPAAPAPSVKPSEPGRPAATAGAREEIAAVLGLYKVAWEGLNPAALERVQALSAAEAADVRRFMGTADRYQLEMSVQSITVDPSGRTAVARVTMTRRFDPKIGRAPAAQRATNDVRLERRGEAWLITSIR